MSLVNPPDLQQLSTFIKSLPSCPAGCPNASVYLSPTFRTPTADDTMDTQIDQLIAEYSRDGAAQLQSHIEEHWAWQTDANGQPTA